MKALVSRWFHRFGTLGLCWMMVWVQSGCDTTRDSDAAASVGQDSGPIDAYQGGLNSDQGTLESDGGVPSASDLGGPDLVDASRGSDRSDEVYARTTLLEVNIEMDPADYNALRFQRRAGLNILAPECTLPPSPYTWFSARVSVNGEQFENVGIRKKGFFGSVSASKPSFKVKLGRVSGRTQFLQ